MKKTNLLLTLFALTLTGCNSSNSIIADNNANTIDPVESINVIGTNNETLKILARQTVLGFSSISNVNSNALAKKREMTEDEIVNVKDTLNEIEILLNSDNLLTATEKESDREEYEYSLELSFSMFEKNETFILYYNEVIVEEDIKEDYHHNENHNEYIDNNFEDKNYYDEEKEHSHNNEFPNLEENDDSNNIKDNNDYEYFEHDCHKKHKGKDNHHKGHDEDEIETRTSFKGLAVYNDSEYEFHYNNKVESEDDENEEETNFKLFLDKNSFIKIKQGFESEDDENEVYYSYTFFQNAKKVEEFKFKEEIENNRHHIKLDKNGQTYIIKYENIDGEELLRVAFKTDRNQMAYGYFKRVVITDENNVTTITYEYLTK